MDADYSVELGADDPVLEFPWRSEDGALCFIDLRKHPEDVSEILEARNHSALRDLLLGLNAENSPFQTAKCDVWTDDDLGPAEDIYSATTKCSSYVDVLLADTASDAIGNFDLIDRLAKGLTSLLDGADETPAATETVIRRLYLRDTGETGYYMTVYVSGYGDAESEAERNWASALKELGRAFAKLSSEDPRQL